MPATHPFRKKWGQNFLRDPNTITKIIGVLAPGTNDTILEIGPGDGVLTDRLSKAAGHIHAVEIDPLLIKHLGDKHYHNVAIHEGDILDWDISILPEGVKIIGNLPYYISSPILFRFLGMGADGSHVSKRAGRADCFKRREQVIRPYFCHVSGIL
jgi:16S rRNA (adenine1518-N6/adenine1519-N6)-dimethyltransferase